MTFVEQEGQDPTGHKEEGFFLPHPCLHQASSGAYQTEASSKRVCVEGICESFGETSPAVKFSPYSPLTEVNISPLAVTEDAPLQWRNPLKQSFRWQSVLPDEVATTVTLIQVSFLRLTSALPAPDKAVALHWNLLHNLQGPVQNGNAEPLAQSLWRISRWPQ